jgi:glucosylceramidase
MKMKKKSMILGVACLLASCAQSPQVRWVSTTAESGFIDQPAITATPAVEDARVDVIVRTDVRLQEIDGFGGCFNELGWTTISALKESDREAVIRDLFSPEGMNFTFCRMPVGANDFARDWYSYDETEGDFEMKNFSIENDRETLIPFIHAAQRINPALRIWASPWSPPTWMKYGKHYACLPSAQVNDLEEEANPNREGTNMFIQEAAYFEAYALYFRKFIEAYRAEGIPIEMVAPQNEFNSCQIFPSCTWTASGLSEFIGEYLAPQMEAVGVGILLGTMERPNHLLVDTIMERKSGASVRGIGFQWAGKDAIARVHASYPGLPLMQSESECGNGRNTWEYCFYIWGLMKHYFGHGISSYMYWNISLDAEAGNTRWRWPQNSLLSVDVTNRTYTCNPEYYLMKHLSHFVLPGARRVATEGNENILAFINPDETVVLITANAEAEAQTWTIEVDGQQFVVTVPAASINTFVM